MNDNTAKSMGFKDAAEFNRMVADADITSLDKVRAFNDWKTNDGTKNGLIKLKMDQHGIGPADMQNDLAWPR